MSLAEQLDKIRVGGMAKRTAEERAVMGAETQALRDSGAVDRALKVGDNLPEFALENAKGDIVRSSDLLAKGPMVLTVFRGVW